MSIILAIGAHYDDIEVGCGGTLFRHSEKGDEMFFGITSSDEHRTGDIQDRYQEQVLSAKLLGVKLESVFRFSYHDEVHNIVGELDKLGADVIYTQYEFDTHQDHRRSSIIGQAVGRKKRTTTLFYDSGTAYDFHPNVFSMINFDEKRELMKCHKSQIEPGPVNLDVIKKMNAHWATFVTEQPHSYAEGFVARKMIYTI